MRFSKKNMPNYDKMPAEEQPAQIPGGAADDAQKNLIENEPLSPAVGKYKKKIDGLFAEAKELKERAEALARSARDIDINDPNRQQEREGMLQQSSELQSRANQNYRRVATGGEDIRDMMIELPIPVREGVSIVEEDGLRNEAAIEEYRDAISDSPQMILRMARESGSLLNFDRLNEISPRLLRDSQFIEVLAETDGAKNSDNFQVAKRDNLFKQIASNTEGQRGKKINVEREIRGREQERETEVHARVGREVAVGEARREAQIRQGGLDQQQAQERASEAARREAQRLTDQRNREALDEQQALERAQTAQRQDEERQRTAKLKEQQLREQREINRRMGRKE